jgi:hypothetical protein
MVRVALFLRESRLLPPRWVAPLPLRTSPGVRVRCLPLGQRRPSIPTSAVPAVSPSLEACSTGLRTWVPTWVLTTAGPTEEHTEGHTGSPATDEPDAAIMFHIRLTLNRRQK